MEEKITYKKLAEAYERLLEIDNELALENDGLQKKDPESCEIYKRLYSTYVVTMECLRDALKYIQYKEYEEKTSGDAPKTN